MSFFTDSIPPKSWQDTVSLEGDTDDNVSLLPFQRSLILVMLAYLQEQPYVFFNDTDEVTPESITDIIEDTISRLAF